MDYLLLPAKDEAENLPGLIRRAREVGFAVVVCDDGSTDATAAVAEREGALVLRHSTNQGLAQALRTLFDWAVDNLADDDIVVVMDADGTMDPKTAREGVEALRAGAADLVVFSRYQSAYQVPWRRKLFSWGARALFTLTWRIPGVTDYTTGFRAYSVRFLRHYAERHPRWFDAKGFTAQTELLYRAHRMGARILEVPGPIDYSKKRGASKMRVLPTVREYLTLAFRRK